MAYVAFGFPKALKTGLGGSPDDGEAIYASNVTADFVIVVFSSAVQVWSGSQHRVKLGEVLRTKEQLEEEGPNVRAHWCPQKRVLAVAVSVACSKRLPFEAAGCTWPASAFVPDVCVSGLP